MIKTAKFILPLVLFSIAICGCGGKTKLATVKVSGVVKIGGSPAGKDISVTLVPDGDETLKPASAVTDESGKVTFFAGTSGTQGVMPGKYKVVLTKTGDADGGYMNADNVKQGEGGSTAAPEMNADLPKKFTSSKTSDLTVEITKAVSDLVIDVPAS